MKPSALNRQAVRMAATMLMLAEGSTTTLTVRQYLRNQGYRAGQSEVSSWLFRIAQRERWVIDDNGLFRVYYFANSMSQLLLPAALSTPATGVN